MIEIHGKQYVTVAERVTAAHTDEGFSMLSEEIFSIGERHFVRITLDVKGRQFIGSAEIKFSAKPGTPDASNPVECASTSALGRALGFAGYGSVESIASADEIVRAEAKPIDLKARLTDLVERAKTLGGSQRQYRVGFNAPLSGDLQSER